jgi:hypothetical protein
MRAPRAALRALAMAGALLAGCASGPQPLEGGFDARLLPAAAARAGTKARGAVEVQIDAAAAAAVTTVQRLRTVGAVPVHLAMGQIVEGAARAALAEEFEPAAPGAPAFVMLLRSVRFDVDDHVVYIIPLGPLTTGRIDLDSRLWVEVQLSDAQGRVQWSRTYDSGREPPATGRRGVVGPFEGRLPPEQLQAIAHEQAARLMQVAAQDVRRWVEGERLRERVL